MIGIEAITDEGLAQIGKHQRVAAVEQSVGAFHDHDIAVHGMFVPPPSGTRALRAGLGRPTAVVVSPDGGLYVALEGGNAIVEITGSTVAVTAGAADFAGLDPQYPGSDCMPSGLCGVQA